MKKLIFFLIAAIVIAYAALNVAPQLYARHVSDQYLKEGISNLSAGDIGKGIEKLRLAVHVTKDTNPLLKSKELNDLPGILLNAARTHPMNFEQIAAFASENKIMFPCAVKLEIFSSLLDATYALFLQKTTGAETIEKIKRIEENLTAASKLSAGCEPTVVDQAKFNIYKKAYEKIAGKPFVTPPVSVIPPQAAPATTEPAEAAPRPLINISSILDTAKSVFSSLKTFVESKTGKKPAQPPAAQQAMPEAMPQAQPAPAPSHLAPSSAPQPPAAQPAVPSAVPQKPASLLDGIKANLAAIGLKVVKVEPAGNRSLYLSVQTSSADAKLVKEMKAIFEVVDKNLKSKGMIDQIPYLDLDILSDSGALTAGWRINLSDYRLYRSGEISGEEFTGKLVRK